MDTPEKLLTQEEVCEWLQISRATLHRLRREGLPGFPVGRQIRFEQGEVKRWLKERRNDAE